jgi:hypothetical protein
MRRRRLAQRPGASRESLAGSSLWHATRPSRCQILGSRQCVNSKSSFRGAASLDLLMTLADDPPVADEVARAIAEYRRCRRNTLRRLAVEAESRRNAQRPGAVRGGAGSFAIGHETDPDLAAQMDNFDVWTRFAVRVKAAGIDAPAFTARLVAAGIVGEDRRALMEPEMLADMQKALDAGDDFNAVVFLEQVQSVYVFDTEWNPEPEYDVLLEERSEVSSPRLPIILVPENVPGEEGSEVCRRVAGHPARFNPKFMGKWTDLDAVLG